jgi:hypothetical protein
MAAAAAVALVLTRLTTAETPTPSSGFSLSVSPPKTELSLSPGDRAIVTVSVANLSESPLDIASLVADFRVTDTSGSVLLETSNPDNPQGLGSSMTIIGAPGFTLGPGQRRELSVQVDIPQNAPGGSRFGAVVFSTGAPPEPGKVTLVSQVASLVIVRVKGASLSELPSTRTAIKISLPISLPVGLQLNTLKDPVSGLDIQPGAGGVQITLPVADADGIQQGNIVGISRAGVRGTGDSAVADVDSLRVDSFLWKSDFDSPEGSRSARVKLSFDLLALLREGSVTTLVQPQASPEVKNAFDTVVGDASITDIAFVIEIARNRLENQSEIGPAVITLMVDRQWAGASDPSLVRILRYAEDGSAHVLDTTFIGPSGDYLEFQASSQGGLSAFGLAALDRPLEPVSLPQSSLAPFIPPSAAADQPNAFTILLSPIFHLSDSAVGVDSNGAPVTVARNSFLAFHTDVQAPSIDDIDIKPATLSQQGTLKWQSVPKIALAGHNSLVLRFQNLGGADYEVSPGLVRIISMNGTPKESILVPNFNVFPGASRDTTLDWVTSSKAFGRYTMAAQVTFGNPPQVAISDPITVWVIPWRWILSLIFIGGGVILGAWFFSHGLQKYVERQVERRVGRRS